MGNVEIAKLVEGYKLLSFIDISGDFRASSQKEKFIVAAAVSIRQRSIGDIVRLMHNLKRDILNNETLEIKSTSFINKDTLNFPEKNKYRFIQNMFEQCLDYHDCFYSAVVIKNEDVRINFPRERLSKHYIYLLQRIQQLAAVNHCQKVVVVIDNENRKIDKWAAYAFNNYLYRTVDGQQLDRVLEVPIFADSEMTVGLQMADIVAGLIKRYYTRGLNDIPPSDNESMYDNKLREYYNIISKRCPNFRGLVGLYEAPPNFMSLYYT